MPSQGKQTKLLEYRTERIFQVREYGLYSTLTAVNRRTNLESNFANVINVPTPIM
jgi:hypothetical protein